MNLSSKALLIPTLGGILLPSPKIESPLYSPPPASYHPPPRKLGYGTLDCGGLRGSVCCEASFKKQQTFQGLKTLKRMAPVGRGAPLLFWGAIYVLYKNVVGKK